MAKARELRQVLDVDVWTPVCELCGSAELAEVWSGFPYNPNAHLGVKAVSYVAMEAARNLLIQNLGFLFLAAEILG